MRHQPHQRSQPGRAEPAVRNKANANLLEPPFACSIWRATTEDSAGGVRDVWRRVSSGDGRRITNPRYSRLPVGATRLGSGDDLCEMVRSWKRKKGWRNEFETDKRGSSG